MVQHRARKVRTIIIIFHSLPEKQSRDPPLSPSPPPPHTSTIRCCCCPGQQAGLSLAVCLFILYSACFRNSQFLSYCRLTFLLICASKMFSVLCLTNKRNFHIPSEVSTLKEVLTWRQENISHSPLILSSACFFPLPGFCLLCCLVTS